MGEGLLVEALKKQHGFQQYLNDKKEWVAKLEAILNDVVYIEGTLVKQLSEESILAVKMKLFLLKVLGSNKVEEITKAWVKASSQKLMQSVEDFVNKDSLLLLVNGWLMSQPFSKEVISACVKSHTKSWTSVEPYSPGLSIDHTETSYGDSVRSWLNSSNGPAKYSLLSGREPDNIVKRTHVNNPAGCFLGSASVLLSDSKSVAIENLKEGDKIFGINGGIGVVSSEKVALELDSVTPLFGFNEEEPFFTSSHPFWTQDGWRAVNPHLAKLDNHWLKVGQLTEGDYVRRVKGVKDGKIDYEWLKISAIHFKDFPAGTKVYGVHTREGPRSYHANGYLVCQNYPEITCQNAVDRMSSLSSEEKKTLQKHMDEMEPMLKKVLGPGPSNAMTSLTKRYLTEKMKNDNKARKDRVPLKEMSLPHVNLTYHAGDTKLGSYSMPKKMSLVRGHLFLDEIHVPAAQVTNDNNVTWTRSVPDGKWEHGSVKLHGNRIQGNGFVALTNNQHDTKSVVSASVTATAHVNTYKCYKSVEASTGASQTTAKWTDYGELSMGVDCSSGTCKTVGKVRIPPMDTLDDLGHHVVFTVDAKQQLLVNVVVPSDFWSYFGCTRLSGTFSMDFETFTGTCVSYDENKPTLQGETYFWKGVIEKNLSANTMLESARNISLKSPIHADPVPLLTTPRYQLLDAVDGSSTTDSESTVAPMANTMATMATQSLSVDELYMITPPDSQTVHELTFNLLQEGMKYDMDNTLREKILGVVKPDLSGDMAAVANSYKTFLGDTFANAYMMNALSQSDTYKDKITDEQRNQLLYFWSGNDKDSLAQNADYNKANNDVSRVAYIQSCPEVEKYISSSQGGPYWAKKLYDKLTETEVLNGLALAAEVSETMSIIQKQSMVLFCLSPKEDYGARFYKKVMMTRLNETSTYFRGERGNTVLMKEIFTDSIHQLIVSVLAGGDATTREVTANLRKDLVEAANEMNVEITADSEETANDMLAHMEEFISGVINLFALQSGTAWEALAKSVSKWQERNPIKAGILKFSSVAICSALWITSIYFTVKTFMQWDSLTVEQKVALIADSVDMFVRTIAGIPDMIANFKTSCKNGKLGFKLIKDKIKAQNKPEAANEMEEVVEKNVEKIDGEPFKLVLPNSFISHLLCVWSFCSARCTVGF